MAVGHHVPLVSEAAPRPLSRTKRTCRQKAAPTRRSHAEGAEAKRRSRVARTNASHLPRLDGVSAAWPPPYLAPALDKRVSVEGGRVQPQTQRSRERRGRHRPSA